MAEKNQTSCKNEKLLSMTEICFIDSSEIMTFSIIDLTRRMIRLKKAKEQRFMIIEETFPDILNLHIILRSLIFPSKGFYETSASLPCEFPTKGEFRNETEDEILQREMYRNSEIVYHEMNCNNLLEYAKIYSKWSVASLGEVIYHFVEWCTTNLNLSPLHSPKISSFAFDAVLSQVRSSNL
jgi:hypothetical protein